MFRDNSPIKYFSNLSGAIILKMSLVFGYISRKLSFIFILFSIGFMINILYDRPRLRCFWQKQNPNRQYSFDGKKKKTTTTMKSRADKTKIEWVIVHSRKPHVFTTVITRKFKGLDIYTAPGGRGILTTWLLISDNLATVRPPYDSEHFPPNATESAGMHV